MFRALPALLLVVAQFSWAACDDSLPSTGSRDDVLIIVNDNAVDSCEVGRYYAEQRGLGRSNILHVKTPANPTISYVQYEILRNQVVRDLQQRIGGTAATCSTPTDTTCTAVTEQLSASSIKYLVLTKGVPARLVKVTGETWDDSIDEAGSVDGYLRNQLGRIFFPARIDGLDLAAAKRLVDRALAAEDGGWRGELQTVASKNDAAGWGMAQSNSRFAKSDYALDPVVPVYSEKLVLAIPPGATHSGEPGIFSETGSFYWRYVFGLFAETDKTCTGNVASVIPGDHNAFYLNNVAYSLAGKAPSGCRVKLTKGNGAGIGVSEIPPGFTDARTPLAVDTVAYLGHLDNQPTLGGYFSVVKNWRRNADVCEPLCANASNPTSCRAASTDTFKELNTDCVGVADGFIGHNFQSWPLSFFTTWPTGWRPISLAGTGSSEALASDIGGSYQWFVAYPRVRTDDGDGDSTSLWFGAHDKVPTTTCYASDLTTTGSCADLNSFMVGQKVSSTTRTIGGTEYYRLSLSYRSTAGEASKTARLAAVISVDDTGASPRVQRRLLSKLNSQVYAALRDSSGDVIIGTNSGGTWKRASAIFKLDTTTVLPEAIKQIGGMAINIYSADNYGTLSNFSGTVGIDSVVLEKVDASEVVETPPAGQAIVNSNFSDGHGQFAVGDWAATFTSRLNGAAFWGSTTHNCGGTSAFTHVTDTLASFVGGDSLAAAVWQKEGCSGGLLYGDPLYSPVAVRLNPLPKKMVLGSTLSLTGSVFNGSGSGIDTRYSIHYCYSKDFFTCDRTPDTSWRATNIVEASGQPQGRNISLGTLDTSEIELKRTFILRLTVKSTKNSKDTLYSDFSQPIIAFNATADSDGDGITDGAEITLGTDPLLADTDGDHLPDNWEVANGFDPLVANTGDDIDGDGLVASVELYLGTSDTNVDSDGDGYQDFVEALSGSQFPGNPALQPPFAVGPIPLYAGVGHPYHVVLQKRNGATVIEPLQQPDNSTLVGDVFDWTPTYEQGGSWHEIQFGPAATPTRLRVYVIRFDGDVNGDGDLDRGDVLALEKIVTGAVQPTPIQLYHSDIYPLVIDEEPDGKLDLSDLLVLEKLLADYF